MRICKLTRVRDGGCMTSERPSAATSRENPEQADYAAQTGGELAAAPCSAGVWFMDDIDHNWGGRYNELAMNVAASYRTMHDSLKPSCIIVRDNGQLSSTVLTDALLSHGLPAVRLYRTVGVRANNQPDVMSHPAIQFLGSMNNVENPVKCGWMISGWQCPTLNKVADGIGWEWRL